MDECNEIVEETNRLPGSRCEPLPDRFRRHKIRRLGHNEEATSKGARHFLQRLLIGCIGIPMVLSCIAAYFNASYNNYLQTIFTEFLNNYDQHYNHIFYGKANYCSNQQSLNIENIFKNIKAPHHILHQDKALQNLREALQKNSVINAISIMGPVGVGKSLVVNILAEHFLWRRNIHPYSWNTAVKYEVQKFRLIRLIISRLSKCGRNLIIIENLETCDHAIVPIINDLLKTTNKSVIIIYIFTLNTKLDKDTLIEDYFFLKRNLADTNIIQFKTLTKDNVKDCITREAALENITLTTQDFNEILDTSDPYRFGCKNINAKVRLYGTIKNNV